MSTKFKKDTVVIYTITNEQLTVVSDKGFTNKGITYIPCVDKKNDIDDYPESDLVLFDEKETLNKIQNLINVLSDEQKVLAIQMLDKSLICKSVIQNVAQDFAHVIPKNQKHKRITKQKNIKTSLCDIILTEDDLSIFNIDKNGWSAFGIECLTHVIFNDANAYNLESYLNDNDIFADIFNVEYMGFLTGKIKIKTSEINTIIPFINEFLKNNTK